MMPPAPGAELAEELCVHRMFERRVAEAPETVAIRAAGQTLSYGELNAQANQLAHRLGKLGVQHGSIVAVCLERSRTAIVAMLAILKAGGAYLPLDPRTPAARRGFMIKDSEALVLLTSGISGELFGLPPERVIDLEHDAVTSAESVENPLSLTNGESLAYIIYTSGSTGLPKGVLVPHRGIVRLVCAVDYVQLDRTQTVLWLAPISFDLSTFEIWGPLLNHGRCVVYPNGTLSLAQLGDVLEGEAVNTLWLISSLFNTIVDEAPHILAGVRQLLIGGEAMSPAHAVRAQALLPQAQISNGYGPTETTVVATCYALPRDFPKTATSVPIGGPVGKTSLYILDAAMHMVAPGEIGELYIGGEGVAHGYLNAPALTAEKFVADPFGGVPGGRLFKTGDLAHWLPDGNLDFDGRADEQVKIRGFRIEPGEIESIIQQHPRIERCAVLAAESAGGEKSLVAFLVPERSAPCAPGVDERVCAESAQSPLNAAEARTLTAELQTSLRARLPEYMVPSALVYLATLPLTTNGKLDRKALLALDREAPVNPPAAAAPDSVPLSGDPLETKLCAIWQGVLGIPNIDPQHNFFELGGNSLQIARIFAQIHQQFGKHIPIVKMFERPTIAKFAVTLREALNEPQASARKG